jgi:hypothetical protein
MWRFIFLSSLTFTAMLSLGTQRANAQAILAADDAIAITQGQREKAKAQARTRLGPSLGAGVSPFQLSISSGDIGVSAFFADKSTGTNNLDRIRRAGTSSCGGSATGPMGIRLYQGRHAATRT